MDRAEDIHPCCLTIAGSDSGGNAGVQADLRAFHAYGMHGCTVITALTAQNPFGVSGIHSVPADFVARQLDAVIGVYAIRALKTGMIADARVIDAVADRLRDHHEIACVIDPVMVATSGARLIPEDAVKKLESRLFPIAALITPNLPEAEELCGKRSGNPSRRIEDVRALSRELHDRYGCAVLVKGGHGSSGTAVDVLCYETDGKVETEEFSSPWIGNPISTHGTGCSLAASLAAELALGRNLHDAVSGAKRTVRLAIEKSFLVGKDCGVLGFPFD